jgi:peroxiredoxin
MSQIKVGDVLPKNITLMSSSNISELGACAKPLKLESSVLHKGRVVLFAVPGAFTPTCHLNHLPEFIDKFSILKEKGIETIACLSTNDHFVMDAWAKSLKIPENSILMLSDGNGDFVKSLGLSQDLSSNNMGSIRSQRFALIAKDGVVEYIGVGKLDVSGAAAVLAKL